MKNVQDVMTKEPVCCSPNDTVQQAARLMKQQDVGSLPVCAQDRKLVGIITDRDIAVSVVADGRDATTIRVEQCMTKSDLATCRPQDDLSKVLELMKRQQVRRIPVVDDQGRVIGIVAQADIVLEAERPSQVQETVAEISKPSKAAA